MFKLRPKKRGWLRGLLGKPGPEPVHPMAFLFPTRAPERLFFPTVHVHDGDVHQEAKFDHTLYCQVSHRGAPDAFTEVGAVSWTQSKEDASAFVKIQRTQGTLAGDDSVFRAWLFGERPNADVWVGSRLRRDRTLLEAVVAVLAPDSAQAHLATLDRAVYPGWADDAEMKLAFVRLWSDGHGQLAQLVAEPQSEWNRLRSRALRPRALAADYPTLPWREREEINRADTDEVEAWLTALIGASGAGLAD